MNVNLDIGSTVLIQAIPHSQQDYCKVVAQIRTLPSLRQQKREEYGEWLDWIGLTPTAKRFRSIGNLTGKIVRCEK
jgi:hypothetical protein